MSVEEVHLLLVQSDPAVAEVLRDFLEDRMEIDVWVETLYTGAQVDAVFDLPQFRSWNPNLVLSERYLRSGEKAPLRSVVSGLRCRRPLRSGLIVTSTRPTVITPERGEEDMGYAVLRSPFRLRDVREIVLKMQAFISGPAFPG